MENEKNTLGYAQVKHLSNALRLGLDDAQIKEVQEGMAPVLAIVARLSALDVEGVAPTTHGVSMQNALREDVLRESTPKGDLLAQAPAQNGACYVVPKVLD